MAEALQHVDEPGTTPPPMQAKDKPTRAAKQLREEEDFELKSWLDGFSGLPDFKITLSRESPERYMDQQTKGFCKTYTQPITEEDIYNEFGGGTYTLRIHKTGSPGSIATNRRLTIQGPPKLTKAVDPTVPSAPTAVDRVMSVLERTNQEANDRARKAEEAAIRQPAQSGFDPRLLEVINAPMLRQMEMLAADKRDLEARLAALMTKLTDISNRPREESLGDKLVLTMSEKESGRIEALRAQHDSEKSAIREVHKLEMERVHAMYKDQIASMERSHEREIRAMERAGDGSTTTLKSSYEMRIDAMKSDVTRLERELTKAEAKISALETMKVKTPLEQLQDAAAYKETLEDLGLTGGDKEEGGSTVERIIGGVMNSEIAKGLAGRLANPAMAAAAPAVMGAVAQAQPQATPDQAAVMQAIQQQPIGKPFRLPDGNTYVKRQFPDGRVVLMPFVKKKLTPEQAEAKKRANAVQVTPEQVALAVAFIETAISNGIEAEAFATTVKSSMDKAILGLLRQRGVDFFLNEVAKPSENSPLLTQAGRNFVRRVGKILVGEPETAAEEAPPVDEVPSE